MTELTVEQLKPGQTGYTMYWQFEDTSAGLYVKRHAPVALEPSGTLSVPIERRPDGSYYSPAFPPFPRPRKDMIPVHVRPAQ